VREPVLLLLADKGPAAMPGPVPRIFPRQQHKYARGAHTHEAV